MFFYSVVYFSSIINIAELIQFYDATNICNSDQNKFEMSEVFDEDATAKSYYCFSDQL